MKYYRFGFNCGIDPATSRIKTPLLRILTHPFCAEKEWLKMRNKGYYNYI